MWKLDSLRSASVTGARDSAEHSRGAAMAAISLAVIIATLDVTVTNTALPTIRGQLHVPLAHVIWVVTSYQIAMVAAMLPFAGLGEVIGHRRVFIGGTLLLTLASLGCGLAGSLPELIGIRFVQGLGAAAVMSANTALVRAIYPPHQLGRGLGLNVLVIALGLGGGPVLASAVLSVASWHWLFFINVPVGIAAALLAWRLLPGEPSSSRRFDVVGALLCAALFGFTIQGLTGLSRSLLNPATGVEWTLAAICGYCLIRRERGRSHPILPTDLFRNMTFSLSTVTAFCAYATQGLALVSLPFVFQTLMHHSQSQIGFLIAPWPVAGALMGPMAGSLSDRIPASILRGLGLFCLGAGVAILAYLPVTATTWNVVGAMVLCGLGFGLFLSPNQRTLMASAPPGRNGSASGVLGLARLLGQSTGAALVAVSFSLSATHGATMALWMGCAFALAGSGLSVVSLLSG